MAREVIRCQWWTLLAADGAEDRKLKNVLRAGRTRVIYNHVENIPTSCEVYSRMPHAVWPMGSGSTTARWCGPLSIAAVQTLMPLLSSGWGWAHHKLSLIPKLGVKTLLPNKPKDPMPNAQRAQNSNTQYPLFIFNFVTAYNGLRAANNGTKM